MKRKLTAGVTTNEADPRREECPQRVSLLIDEVNAPARGLVWSR
jgi:hypothetical protein